MPISDHQMIESWREVLRLSNLEKGQIVTILTSVATHPQTLQTAKIAAQSMGAIVSQLDLPPVNGEKAFSRDALAYLGTTPLTGNRAAIAALTESDLVLDLTRAVGYPEDGYENPAGCGTTGSFGPHGANAGGQGPRCPCGQTD
jgi:2,5-dihydroxypyridine 5,6-dioxygenase